MAARGIAAFVGGLADGYTMRKRWEDAEQERKDRAQQRIWDMEDRNNAANDRARKLKRDEEDRAIAAEDRARRRKLEDEKLAAYREDRKRAKDLQAREDQTYFEEQGDKKAAGEAYTAAKDAHDRATRDAKDRSNRRKANLGILPPVDEPAYVLPGSEMDRNAETFGQPQAPRPLRIRPDAEEAVPAPIEPYGQTPRGTVSNAPMDPPALDLPPQRQPSPSMVPAQPAPAAPAERGLLSRLNPFGPASAAEIGSMEQAQALSQPAARGVVAPAVAVQPGRPADPGGVPVAPPAADPMLRAQQLSQPAPAGPQVAGVVDAGTVPPMPAASMERGITGAGTLGAAQRRDPQPVMTQIAQAPAAAAPAASPSVQAAVVTAPGARDVPGMRSAMPGGEDDHVPDFMSFYRDVAAPKIRDRYLATGRPEAAATFEKWVADEGRKAGMEAWSKGVQAAARGDEGAFLDHMIDAYNADAYFDDGYDIVRSKSGFIRGKDGNPTGAEITFRDQRTGKTSKQTFNDIGDIYEMGIQFLAPESVFEYGSKQIEAAAKAQQDEIKHLRTLERDSIKAGDPVTKRRQELVEKLLENDLTGELTKNPAALLARVDEIMAAEGSGGVSRPGSRRGTIWTGDE